ncbi:MAG: hypothetical protein HZB65_02700 [Candidatus Aenigmarchaeota archaeon]|nr:hypothetical protein [Candidatus Aenigmarchaeota archaeon]
MISFLAVPIYGHDVQMNMRYNIGNDDKIYANNTQLAGDGEWIGLEKNYIVSQSSDIVAGLVFAGSVFNKIGFARHGPDYTLSMNQGDDNKFIIVMTNSSHEDIDKKYESVGKLLSTSFGHAVGKGANFIVYLQLQYYDIDILDSFFWQGERVIQVRNEGKNERGITKIAVTKIR